MPARNQMLLTIYRVSHYLAMKRIPILPRLIKGALYVFYNCVIPPECQIGKNTRLYHSGLGIIIHPNTIIGQNCNIYNHVVFGGGHDTPDGTDFHILIGNNVNIGSGAKILCKESCLRIGNNVSIGANAVVIEDVPDDAVVVGIPAKIIKYKQY